MGFNSTMERRDKRSKLMFLLRLVVLLLTVTVISTMVSWKVPKYWFPLDLFLMSVIVIALRHRPMTAQLFGLVAGLLEDSFTAGVVGLNALSYTVIGFVVAALKEAVMIQGLFQRILTFALATITHVCLLMFLSGVFSLPYTLDWLDLTLKVVFNTVAGFTIVLYISRQELRKAAVKAYERS